MSREKRGGSEGVWGGCPHGGSGLLPGKFQEAVLTPRLLPQATGKCVGLLPGSASTPVRMKPLARGMAHPWALFSSPLALTPPLHPWAGGRGVEAWRSRTVAWLPGGLSWGLHRVSCILPSPHPSDALGEAHDGQASAVLGQRDQPPLLAPQLLTQHIHSVQPGILSSRVVGHAGVGTRVGGPQALQHQGAAVQVEPAAGRDGQEQAREGLHGGPATRALGRHRLGLTGGGGPCPGPVGHRPSARPRRGSDARQPRSPAAPPAPPGRCAPA